MLQDFPTSTPVLDGDTTTQMRKEIESSKGPGLLMYELDDALADETRSVDPRRRHLG